MDRIRNVNRLVEAIALVGGLYVIRVLQTAVTSRSKGLVPALAFLFAVLFLLAVSRSWAWALTNWAWLRRIVLGSLWLEGVWFSPLHIDGQKRYGLLRIRFDGERYEVVGEQFDVHGIVRVSWTSQMSAFNGHTLCYAYDARYLVDGSPEARIGLSMIHFTRNRVIAAPQFCNGHFIDVSAPAEGVAFSGFKIRGSHRLKQLKEVSTPQERREMLEGLIEASA